MTALSGAGSLEQRIALLERRLNEVELLKDPGRQQVFKSRSTSLPRLSGFTVSQGVAQIFISWTPASTADVFYYEVQESKSRDFVDASTKTYRTTDSFLSVGIPPDEGAVTRYFRARLVTSNRRFGPYTLTASTAPGQVEATSLADGSVTTDKLDDSAVSTVKIADAAITSLSSFSQTSGFSTLDTNGETETYGPLSLTIDSSGAIVLFDVLISATISSAIASASDDSDLLVELLRRPSGGADSVIDTAEQQFRSNINSSLVTVPVLLLPETGLTAGTYEYRIRLTAQEAGGNAFSCLLSRISIEATQAKK